MPRSSGVAEEVNKFGAPTAGPVLVRKKVPSAADAADGAESQRLVSTSGAGVRPRETLGDLATPQPQAF